MKRISTVRPKSGWGWIGYLRPGQLLDHLTVIKKHGKGFRVDVYKNDYRNVQIHVMMILELGIIVASNDNGW